MSLMMLQIQILSLPLFTCLVFLVVLVLYWKRFKTQYSTPIGVIRLPPGPWKLPVIGNLHQLAGSLPHHSLRHLAQKHGPIMHLKLGEISAVVISSPELTKELLKTHETAFSQRPATGLAVDVAPNTLSGIFLSPYNDYWRQMRKICVLELLSAKSVQSFQSVREEEAWNVVESINYLSSSQAQAQAQAHPVAINLSEMIFSMQNSITARAALGRKCRYQQEFISMLKESLVLTGGFGVPDLFPSLKFLRYVTRAKPALEKIHRRIDQILNDVINEHKLAKSKDQQPAADGDDQEDLVDVLLKLEQSGELQFDLTTNNIKAIILEMYAGGSDTSATTAEWAMSELLRNPKSMEKAQAEVRRVLAGKRKIHEADIQKLDYLKLVIKETLRLHPPATLIVREASERRKISGYDIPFKTKVLVNVWAMGRDPTHWPNADCFLPERFQLESSSVDFRGTNFEFIPFGAGKRICPGISFATASLEIALCQLLYHFNWKLPNGTKHAELDMTESMGLNTKRRNDLYVMAIPFIPITNG